MTRSNLAAMAVFLIALFVTPAFAESVRTFTSSGTLVANGRVTATTTANTVAVATTTDEDIGVSLSANTTGLPSAVVLYRDGEIGSYLASGAITAGANVYPDTGGKVTATIQGKRIGIATTATSADGDTCKVLKLAPKADRIVVTSTVLTAASVDTWMWIAPFPCKVVSVKEIHSVAGGSSAAVKARKVTDTSAPGASAGSTVKELATAGFDLTAAANTTQTATLSATASDYTLATGNKIGLDLSGTLTALDGCIVVIELVAQ